MAMIWREELKRAEKYLEESIEAGDRLSAEYYLEKKKSLEEAIAMHTRATGE